MHITDAGQDVLLPLCLIPIDGTDDAAAPDIGLE